MNFTSIYDLYKWNVTDSKKDTVAEMSKNSDKIEALFLGVFEQLSQLQVSVNVRQPPFNAKGDGIADDTKAFNDAITAVSTKGGIVLVPQGTYMIEGWVEGSESDYPLGGIRLKSNVTLQFMPGAKVKAKPTLKSNYAVINITNCQNVNILGGEVIGVRDYEAIKDFPEQDPQWGYGVAIVGSTNVTIQGVTVRNCFGDGFLVGRNRTVGSESKNVKLLYCNAINNRRQGASVIGGIDVWITGGVYEGTNGHFPESGIDLEPNNTNWIVRNVRIEGVTLKNNSGHGIQIGNYSENCSIVDNFCYDNGLNGIYGGQTTHHIIKGNHCYENGESGLFLIDAHSCVVSDNKFYKNKTHGSMLGNGTHNIFNNNHFYENSQKTNSTFNGFEVFSSSYNSFQGNVFRVGTKANKQKYGLNINTADCDRNLVVMNDFRDGGVTLGFRDVGNFTETTAGNRKKDGTWGMYAG